MKRYLIYISYIGTNFRGVQRHLKDGALTDPNSIQGLLELAFKRFKPVNEPIVTLSSRTDQGVHALSSTAHVDLIRSNLGDKEYDPEWLLHGLNRTFDKVKADLRVQKVQIVPHDFNARYNAEYRTYMYRFAVRKSSSKLPETGGLGYGTSIPMSEWKRCCFIHKTEFDVTKVEEALKLFIGTHDFRTFMGRPKLQQKNKETIRTILELKINPAQTLLSKELDPIVDEYDFYQVICKGRSFLYRQVRRIVGVLIAVAQGKLQLADVKRMIDTPSPDSWTSTVAVVPPYGLYLLEVGYKPEDLVENQENEMLEKQRRALKQTQTRVTLSSGQVFMESGGALFLVEGVISPGFVVDTKPDLQVGQVLPGLLLGSQDVARDTCLLQELKVTHVLSVGVCVTPPLTHVKHCYIELLDLPESDIGPALLSGCNFIQLALQDTPSATVLVHCNAGVSRAPTLVIAYLIKYRGMNFETALTLVKHCRPVVRPNDGFVRQLKTFNFNSNQ